MRSCRRGGLACCATLVVLAGCGGGVEGEGEGGFGTPRQPADEPVPGTRTEIRGTVEVEPNGCLTLDTGSGDRRWIVWPADQEQEGGQPVLAGRRVGEGDALAGTGAEVPADALPGWADPAGYFHAYGGFCSAGEIGVVVLDEVARD